MVRLKPISDVLFSYHVIIPDPPTRLAILRNSPGASSDLLYLLGNMPGLLGTAPPSDDSTSSSMIGLMGNGILKCLQFLVVVGAWKFVFMHDKGEVTSTFGRN